MPRLLCTDPGAATPLAAAEVCDSGKPCWCALQCERALADISFGAQGVAQLQFPASAICPAAQGLQVLPARRNSKAGGEDGGNKQRVLKQVRQHRYDMVEHFVSSRRCCLIS